jgi:P-type Mg2+ transporter
MNSILPNRDISYFARENKEKLYSLYKTSPHGLTHTEAENRLLIYGKNTLKVERKKHIIIQYLSTLKNPILIILLIVSGISFIMGETINATIVGVMIFLSSTLNFLQEYKADKSAKKLAEKVSARSTVIRSGEKNIVNTKNICPGDILELNAGDMIPADARIIQAKDFFIDQANLTGESFPVEKTIDPIINQNPNITDLSNIIFAGTSVITGTALAIVIKTGTKTQFGAIAENLSESDTDNEFTRGVYKFSIMIMRIIITFVLIIFLINSLMHHNLLESFTFSIAVAVGLTPEFLPMIMSVTMGKGSLKMAKKGVIVKKLSAIPSFGSMDTLCTDKTGTLTQAKIQLIKCIDIFNKENNSVLLYSYLNSYYQTGISNPMDEAVIRYIKLNIANYHKVDEIPFDFSRKKMSVVVEAKNQRIIITKGAPEEIFKNSLFYRKNGATFKLNDKIHRQFEKTYRELSSDGFRVLAVAIKKIDRKRNVYDKHDENDLEIIGFAAFLDPAKPGTKEAILELENMGIEIKVITGDNELVAQKICRDVGITIKGIMLENEIQNLSDEALKRRVIGTTIFARFSPLEKRRVIDALKANGRVVGYMGDGINDASSLKSADVGISVSNAVDVAKESADIILTHKSLHELKDGVIEGRITFGNTMKYIMMGLSSNFGNMFSVLGAVIFLPFLPMLPIQILLNNFLYDFSQLTIPSDNVDEEYIQKPKRWDIRYIRNFMFIFGPISSLFDFTTFFVLFVIFKTSASAFQTGWFMESLATQTLVIHIIRTRKLPVIGSNASIYLWLTTTVAVITGWFIPSTGIGKLFQFTPLSFPTIVSLILIVSVYLFLTEFGKRLFYRSYDKLSKK